MASRSTSTYPSTYINAVKEGAGPSLPSSCEGGGAVPPSPPYSYGLGAIGLGFFFSDGTFTWPTVHVHERLVNISVRP